MSIVNNIAVTSLVGALCVSADDGQRLHDAISRHLKLKEPVAVSFRGVETMISAFLNAAIGQLYGEYNEDDIRDLLSVKDMEPDDLGLLKRVIENAKIYFLNRKSFDDQWKNESGNE